VRRFGGAGQPPSHLEWDGKDENGLPLPDGVYRYSLVVKDAVGRAVTGPVRTVAISTGGPQGNVPLVPAADNDK
jgi:flagellar hook assembly protein FlgD